MGLQNGIREGGGGLQVKVNPYKKEGGGTGFSHFE